ncbi:MAG: lytic murein transglycosylase, partial [Pseudomonadota bacterium]
SALAQAPSVAQDLSKAGDVIVLAEATNDRIDSVKSQSRYDTAAWRAWKADLKAEVIRKGIPADFADEIFANIDYEPDAIKYDEKQFKPVPFRRSVESKVSDWRINKGVEFYNKHREEINKYAKQYDVSPYVIVALLGVETNYGTYLGKYDVVNAAATLAFGTKKGSAERQASRKKYFRAQVYYALKILHEGHVAREDLKGSWAAAFGINQHMPESFFTYVKDGDGDGDLEILNTEDLSDVFATTANHLREVGYKNGFRWGRDVLIPSGVPVGEKKLLSDWKSKGVTLTNKAPIPVVAGMRATIFKPSSLPGREGYLVYDNFYAFKRWNNSSSFAIGVGKLALEIQDRAP